MKLGVPKENASGENRVAMVPEVVQRLERSGVEVVVEPGAGSGARVPDEHYTEGYADDHYGADYPTGAYADDGAEPEEVAPARTAEPVTVVLPALTGFAITGSREVTEVTIEGVGAPIRTTTRELALRAQRPGTLVIGPVRVRQLELLAAEGVPMRDGRVVLSAVGWPDRDWTPSCPPFV